jgi:predicted DNA-binding protein (UPF0278 family)
MAKIKEHINTAQKINSSIKVAEELVRELRIAICNIEATMLDQSELDKACYVEDIRDPLRQIEDRLLYLREEV